MWLVLSVLKADMGTSRDFFMFGFSIKSPSLAPRPSLSNFPKKSPYFLYSIFLSSCASLALFDRFGRIFRDWSFFPV